MQFMPYLMSRYVSLQVVCVSGMSAACLTSLSRSHVEMALKAQ